jgi:uncharacterized membrane protein
MGIALLLTTLASLTALVVGLMGLLGRLPRNHFAGVRTSATLASDPAWREAHRIGSAPLIFGAVAALMAGLAFLPFVLAGEVATGAIAAVLLAQAALLGGGAVVSWLMADRAARHFEA